MIEPGKPGVKRLMWDEAAYSGLIKAKKADVYLYTRQTYKDPPDYYVTDASLANGKRLTNLGAGQEKFLWSSGTILVDYTSAKGDKLQGALHLPANYEKGKTYPMMVNFLRKDVAECLSVRAAECERVQHSVYTSNGYAVFNPDITYKLNDPGMSAVWCMVPAVKAAIATGVVDPKRVGITGHSWGGYQTAFLVTQTDIFAAAIAGAPLTDLISMYGLIYKNSGVTNGEIFESSQGRFTSGPWDNWEAYTRNSPVAFAKNVKTPLVILHNDKDGAVDFTQGVEYYNTLRRLQKAGRDAGIHWRKPRTRQTRQPEGLHRPHERVFRSLPDGKPMPKWYEEGVQRLQMDDHLRTRSQPAKPPAVQAVKPATPRNDRTRRKKTNGNGLRVTAVMVRLWQVVDPSQSVKRTHHSVRAPGRHPRQLAATRKCPKRRSAKRRSRKKKSAWVKWCVLTKTRSHPVCAKYFENENVAFPRPCCTGHCVVGIIFSCSWAPGHKHQDR
jgi:hypothetical protein